MIGSFFIKMHSYYTTLPEKTSSLTTLPPEIVQRIISKLSINSTNFLLDFINILIALDINNYNDVWLQNLINHFKNKIIVIDLTKKNSIDTPILSILRKNFILTNSTDNYNNNNVNDNEITAFRFFCEKLVLIIDDQFQLNTNDDEFNEFETIYKTFTNFSTSIDIIYCPNSNSIKNDYMNSSIIKLLTNFNNLFQTFNNLIIEFQNPNLIINRSFFDIFNYDFFIESTNINNKILIPRCNQISFPSITELNMDYLTIDSFIYKILEKNYNPLPIINSNTQTTNNFIEKFLNGFLKEIIFYLPNLKFLKFYDYNNDETCNFIDMSTLMLKKFKENSCPLKFLFDLHSFKNWNMPNLIYFTGHRFKYDESKILGSAERMKRSLKDNIKLLHEIAMKETSDATPYFRVDLIPPGVKVTKIINWIPSDSPNSFRSNRSNRNPNDYIVDDDDDDDYDSNNNYTAPSDLSERNQNQNYFNKPILCLKNDSVVSLELKLLTINKNSKSIYIHGLFVKNLRELILQNFTTITKRPKISDKRNSIILLSPTNSNQSKISPASSNNHNINLSNESINNFQAYNSDNSDIDDIHPIGFSLWNNLPSCEFIHFTSHQNMMNDRIHLVDNSDKKQINFLFKIKNLKQNLPKINLVKSFDNFIDERQQYIIV